MTIAKVQSVAGTAATVVLTSVVAANLLTYKSAYFRNSTTGVAEAIPTDTNGTWLRSRGDAPSIFSAEDIGASHFYLQNAAAGTHTVTPEANTSHHVAITEYSGMLTSGVFDQSVAAQNSSGTGTSQSTGTTGTTAQADELVEIAFAMGSAGTGSSNVGLTDPVSGFTTLNVDQNSASSLALMQAYEIVSAIATYQATLNWTFSENFQWWQASIVTYKGVPTAAGGPIISPSTPSRRMISWARRAA